MMSDSYESRKLRSNKKRSGSSGIPTVDVGSFAQMALEDKSLSEDDRKVLESLIN